MVPVRPNEGVRCLRSARQAAVVDIVQIPETMVLRSAGPTTTVAADPMSTEEAPEFAPPVEVLTASRSAHFWGWGER